MDALLVKFKDQWSHMSKRARVWLIGGVLPTFIALVILVFGDMWVGYSLIQAISNHFLDFCLAMFTLAVSIVNAAVDYNDDRKLDKDDQVIIVGASITLGILTIVIFCFIYYRDLLLEKGFEGLAELTPPSILNAAHVILVIFAFFIIHTGVVLENKTV